MKLLFIMETIRARGAERVAAILANQLAAMSHDVYLVCTGFVRGDEYPLVMRCITYLLPVPKIVLIHRHHIRPVSFLETRKISCRMHEVEGIGFFGEPVYRN